MLRTALVAAILSANVSSTLAAGLAVPAGTDTIPPTILSARVLYDPADPEETQRLEFVFSEPVDWFHAILPDNYTDVHTGQTAFQGFWFPPDRAEILFPSRFWGYGTCEQVRVVNVVDLAGNEIVDDGVGNVFTFWLEQVLVKGRMLAHMHSHDDPPHTFAIEGSASPLTWSPQCDILLEDADVDSVYTALLFFDTPCTNATGGPETRDVEFLFSHQCTELEPVANRSFTLDLAAHPDGRDTLDLWWGDGVPTDAGPLPPVAVGPALGRVFPNPVRTGTAVAFSLAERSRVSLEVVDVRGRRIRRLESGFRPAGAHRVRWDGRTDRGDPAPAGVYFVRFEAGGVASARRIVLAR